MKKFLNRKILGIFLLAGLMLVFITPVLAQGVVPCGIDKDGSGKLDWNERCTLCDLIVGIKKIFDYGIKTIAIITIACATFAGVMYVVSSGNESAMESAKNFLKASLIGLAVVLGAWVIVNTTIVWLMPTKTATDSEGFLGIEKTSWYNFNEIDCSEE